MKAVGKAAVKPLSGAELVQVLTQLEELERSATPGRWSTVHAGSGAYIDRPTMSGAAEQVPFTEFGDGPFCASVRNQLLPLIATIREQQSVLERESGKAQIALSALRKASTVFQLPLEHSEKDRIESIVEMGGAIKKLSQ